MNSLIKYHYPEKGMAMDASMVNALSNRPDSVEKLGISFDSDFIQHHSKSKLTTALDSAIVQPVTKPSNGVPVQFLQEFLPGVIYVLTTVRRADRIAPVVVAGEWYSAELVIKIMEHTANPLLAAEHGSLNLVNYNETFETYQVVRFEIGIQQTPYADARSAQTGSNPDAERRVAMAQGFEILRNEVAFYGVNEGTGKTYGILNSPSLPDYVTVAGGTGGTTWNSKTVVEIIADIKTASAAIAVSSGGNVDPLTDVMKLTVPTGQIDNLTKSDSSFSNGKTVKDWINDNFINMTIEQVPQFIGADAGESVFYMQALTVADSGTDGGQCMIQAVPSKLRATGVEQTAKGTTIEGYSMSLAGTIVKRPYAIYRASGI